MVKDIIPFADFAKVDLRVGEIKTVEEVPGSEKLWKLAVFFGDELGTKTIYSGIKHWFTPEDLIGRKLAFVVNLESKKFVINGVEHSSDGMILATGDGEAVLYHFDKDVSPGATLH